MLYFFNSKNSFSKISTPASVIPSSLVSYIPMVLLEFLKVLEAISGKRNVFNYSNDFYILPMFSQHWTGTCPWMSLSFLNASEVLHFPRCKTVMAVAFWTSLSIPGSASYKAVLSTKKGLKSWAELETGDGSPKSEKLLFKSHSCTFKWEDKFS